MVLVWRVSMPILKCLIYISFSERIHARPSHSARACAKELPGDYRHNTKGKPIRRANNTYNNKGNVVIVKTTNYNSISHRISTPFSSPSVRNSTKLRAVSHFIHSNQQRQYVRIVTWTPTRETPSSLSHGKHWRENYSVENYQTNRPTKWCYISVVKEEQANQQFYVQSQLT